MLLCEWSEMLAPSRRQNPKTALPWFMRGALAWLLALLAFNSEAATNCVLGQVLTLDGEKYEGKIGAGENALIVTQGQGQAFTITLTNLLEVYFKELTN